MRNNVPSPHLISINRAGAKRANALYFSLTSCSAALISEDPAAHEYHRRQFLDEYKPKTATETQLVTELADTSWRLNRIPALEADLLSRVANPTTQEAAVAFDLLASLGLHGQRLSQQFQKALDQLRAIQAGRRRAPRTP